MGSVEPYGTAAGRRYRVRYRDPERRTKAKAGFRTRREAGTFLANVVVAVAHGSYIDPGDGRRTIDSLGTDWLRAQTHLKPSALAPLEMAWRVYVEPRWGRTELSRIRHSEVQEWVRQLIEGTAPSIHGPRPLGASSVIRVYGVLAALLDTAVRDRRLAANPARGVHLPRKTRKRHAYLTHTQVELLAQAARGDKATLVRFLSYTGLRWGEATALRVRDVDFRRGRLTISENAVRVNGRVVVGTPKSHHSRSVPLPAFLIGELSELCSWRPAEALVFGDGERHLTQPTAKGGWYVQAIKGAQAVDSTFPRPTIHDLRHTAASLAISAGANVKAVQRMLGHASAAMTLDVYADLFDEDLAAVSTALDRARSVEVVQYPRSFAASANSSEQQDPRHSAAEAV